MRHLNRDKKAIAKARFLRKRMTVSEKATWDCIRNNAFGIRFRTQYPIANYISDFYCAKARLCLEIDGPHHELRKERDEVREAYLNAKGIIVVRIASKTVFTNGPASLEAVLNLARRRIEAREQKLPLPIE